MINSATNLLENDEHLSPYNRIKKWAKSNLEFDEMVNYYSKHKDTWENKRFMDANVEMMILKLSRFKKHETLKYIFDNNKLYRKSFKNSTKSPLNEAVWLGDNSENTENICDKIKCTINILIDNKFSYMGFSEFDESITNAASGDSKETFLDSLMHPDNKLHIKNKLELYKYFTEEWYNDVELKRNMVDMFNKCSVNNVNIFKEKIIYLVSRNVNEMTSVIFKKVMANVANNIYSSIIFKFILSDPNKSCFDEYFKTIKLCEIRKQMCNVILENHKELIEEYTKNELIFEGIEDEAIRNETYDDFLKQNYTKFYSLMAVFYDKDINKSEIIDKLFTNCEINLSKDALTKIHLGFFHDLNIFKTHTLDTLPKKIIETKLIVDFIKKNSSSQKQKFIVEQSMRTIFKIPDKFKNNTQAIINKFINDYENNIDVSVEISITPDQIIEENESNNKDNTTDSSELQNKYRRTFIDYFKYVEKLNIKKKGDFKSINVYFDDIKYSIEKNENNVSHNEDKKIIICNDHINKILIGLVFSFEEINLTTNYLKIMLLIGYLDNNLSENMFNKMTEFVNGDEFDEIICDFDNPTLRGFVKQIKTDLNPI